MAPPREVHLLLWALGRRADGAQTPRGTEGAGKSEWARPSGHCGAGTQRLQHGVEVTVDIYVAGHKGPGHTQLVWRPQQPVTAVGERTMTEPAELSGPVALPSQKVNRTGGPPAKNRSSNGWITVATLSPRWALCFRRHRPYDCRPGWGPSLAGCGGRLPSATFPRSGPPSSTRLRLYSAHIGGQPGRLHHHCHQRRTTLRR